MKVLSIKGKDAPVFDEDFVPIVDQMKQQLENYKSDEILRAVMIIDTGDDLRVHPFEEGDLANIIGLITMAGFVMGNEVSGEELE